MPKLSWNSLLMKQNSSHSEFFYGLLKPFVHYVPVRNDLRDLEDKVQWVLTHQKEVQRMIAETHRLKATQLRREDMFCYMYKLVRTMAFIQRAPRLTASQLRAHGFKRYQPPKNQRIAEDMCSCADMTTLVD